PAEWLHSVTDRDGASTYFFYSGVSLYAGYTEYLLSDVMDANNHYLVTNTYDGTPRVTSQEDALGRSTGQKTILGYVTNTTTVTYPTNSFDGTNPTVADTYDTSGRLIKRVTTPDAVRGDGPITQNFTYDANGNLSTATDGNS